MSEFTTKVRAATLANVAELAKVNKVTASVVLSGGRGNTRVSAATRQRIVDAAKQLHYEPNAIARSLRNRRSNVIGLYFGGFVDMGNLFMSEIVSGIQLGCELHNKDFLVHGTFRGDTIDDIYEELVNGKVDGLVVFTGEQAQLVQRLVDCHLPVVTIADPHPGMPTVTVDDVAGSELLVEHLARKGHRRIMYGLSPYGLTSAERRYRALCAAAKSAGMSVFAHNCRLSDDGQSELEADILAGPNRERPTAIVCWNDELAYGMVPTLRSKGFDVPGDVAVVSFDGFQSAIPPAFKLTTIRAPWRDVARTAVDLLAGSVGKPIATETVLPVELIVGDTS